MPWRILVVARYCSAHAAKSRQHLAREALQAIRDLDLTELQDIDPPRGFGRD
jgi:hypothetical protein